ncbi:MAG: hypothetical protein KDC84_16195, partial [Crocinitomicaceae bacterium]|nr:hypothetical protein [Crocinitomicaceae bacterium]
MKKVSLILTAAAFSMSALGMAHQGFGEKPIKPAQRFDYEADFAAFKEAVEKKDKETIDFMNQAEGTDADMILMYFADPAFMKQLKNTKYSDLTLSDYNGTPVLEFSASVSGSDEEGNEYESG